MDDLDSDEREHTQRTISRLTPQARDLPVAIAQLRADRLADRAERRADEKARVAEFRKWATSGLVTLVVAVITFAIAMGRYQERIDALGHSVERIETLMIRGGER